MSSAERTQDLTKSSTGQDSNASEHNVFGRRRLSLVIVASPTLGSLMCGAANNAATLLTGRAIQGIGSGGINMIIEVVISDLVPLRQRGYFMSIVLLVYGLGLGTGPLIDGSLAQYVG
ncbi:uncharacterized protein PpBr36_10611, partial [Pyricularia pennisetigena]|uniref:uncharacterized protein n=1 Tax=Pyricularia pennisetigena TaxID=1578925 RepID=UPI00114E575B